MSDDEPILDDETLRAWPAVRPPQGFVERVLAARAARSEHGRQSLRWIAGAVGAVVVIATLVVFGLARSPSAAEKGTIVADERVESAVGTRAVAVAEAGAALSWLVEPDGAARIEQPRGNVFYRVERGGPFVVVTPVGEIRVKGTCFRVEVMDMKIGKQALGGAAIGAVAMATILVTVYEGRVLLANEHGQTEVRAGERATFAAVGPPGPAAAAREHAASKPKIIVAEAAPPPAGATREQLITRDAAQRREIAELRAHLAELEAEASGGGPAKQKQGGRSFFAPSKDELLQMAKDCTLQFDMPPLSLEPIKIPPKMAEKLGLTDGERSAIQEVTGEVVARALAQIRAIYVEVTGNAGAAEELSGTSMMREIEDKAGGTGQAMKLLAAERAGLVPPPADPSARPASERVFRVLQGIGDLVEQELAKRIGPERAHAIRAENDGWQQHTKMSGCPDEADEKTE